MRHGPAVAAVFCSLLLVASPAQAAGPAMLYDWLEQQHQIMRRYRMVLRQTVHDLRYNYRMPVLMLPVAMDFYTGYLAHVHEEERRILYPALRPRMTPEQQRQLAFVDQEISSEHDTVRDWQRATKTSDLIDAIDYLEQMLNRHLVLQEQWVFPLLGSLPAKDQAAIVQQLAAMDRSLFGPDGRARREAVFAYLEGEIARISPRM